MKTRIISGVVAFLLFAGVLLLYTVFPVVMTVFICALAAAAVWEMLYVTGYNKNKFLIAVSLAAALAVVLRLEGILPVRLLYIAAVYAALVILTALAKNRTVTPPAAAVTFLVPLYLAFAFWSVSGLLRDGWLPFWLIFVYSWGSDTGAYFTGMALGRHKLCPVLSPKKTVEGFVGGIVFSLLLAILLTLYFENWDVSAVNWARLLIISPLLSAAGVVGDLAASYVKRDSGIKDYGKIMPGHGGVMDRFDSVAFVAPLMYLISHMVGA